MMGIFFHTKNHPTLVDIFTFGLCMCKVKPKGEGLIETRVHDFYNVFPYVFYMV